MLSRPFIYIGNIWYNPPMNDSDPSKFNQFKPQQLIENPEQYFTSVIRDIVKTKLEEGELVHTKTIFSHVHKTLQAFDLDGEELDKYHLVAENCCRVFIQKIDTVYFRHLVLNDPHVASLIIHAQNGLIDRDKFRKMIRSNDFVQNLVTVTNTSLTKFGLKDLTGTFKRILSDTFIMVKDYH